MCKKRGMALGFLATHFVLILSSVSPDLHNAFFHSMSGCPGHANHHPCHSNESEEGEGQGQASECPVLLFSESSDFSRCIGFVPAPKIVECEITLLHFVPFGNKQGTGPFGARGPPVYA